MKDSSRRPAVRIALVFALGLAPIYAQPPLNPPLRNWAAPLYWAPSPAEAQQQRLEQRIAHSNASASAQAVSIFTPPGPLTFIAITPCRVMDTRSTQPFTGAFGPPSLAANVTRSVPMPSSTNCSIPSNAGAYSLNITVVPPGPLSFLSVWPAGQPYPGVSTLNDPVSGGVIANAAIIVAGAAGAIQMLASNPTDVILDINGYYASPTDANGNTGIGPGALQSNTTGSDNVAFGGNALSSNVSGSDNTASGGAALYGNTSGSYNTATGASAMASNSTGTSNTAIGYEALFASNGNYNTASGAGALKYNTADGNTASGYQALQQNTTGAQNTAAGVQALTLNTSGCCNTASGYQALQSNTTGALNTATGSSALQQNNTGSSNTANGANALTLNTTGSDNTADGYGALLLNSTGGSNTAGGYQALMNNSTGSENTASGINALGANTIGTTNTAIGAGALGNNTTGSNNIAIGVDAAVSVSPVNSNNIHIGNVGTSTDHSFIRIGTEGTQSNTFIAGIYGSPVLSSNSVVCVDSTGHLGTGGCSAASSRRFKEQITDMGDSSSKLLQLRPVTFFYKPQYDDGSHSLQYGLIAEEVAKLYPDMVGYDTDGQPSSVKYQALAPMLLNEVQKQNAQIQSQVKAIQLQQEENRKLEDRLAALEALLTGPTSTTARLADRQ
jgi:trimeric autotransporter adhesin